MSQEKLEFVLLPTSDVAARMGIKKEKTQIIKPDKITEYLKSIKDFEVSSITLSIAGSVQTGAITRLFISAGAETGIQVTLIPKTQ